MKFLRSFTPCEWLFYFIVLVILFCIGAPVIEVVRHRDEYDAAEFSAWCKLHHRTDITQEEFKALRRSHLLPEQNH